MGLELLKELYETDRPFQCRRLVAGQWIKIDLLGAQSERCTCDAGGQVQSLNDLLPQLLVYDIHKTTTRDDQIVQFVQVQHGLRHNR